jgi:hypothetical protein
MVFGKRVAVAALVLVGRSFGSAEPAAQGGSDSIQWRPLIEQSMYFLGIQHGFRLATEKGTRRGFEGPYLRNVATSVGSLRGWSDGDLALVNYVGHPMQGAVSAYIFAQNDPRYRRVEFGSSRAYWKGRLRATAYSFAYSTQFEIGPISEATIGTIQSRWPQHGMVDHVVTPVIGMGWQVSEDAIDRFVIQKIENRIENIWVRMMVRGWLNPSRSMANMMRGDSPWHRDTRPGIKSYRRGMSYVDNSGRGSDPQPTPVFEFAPRAQGTILHGGQCVGGGAQGAYRLNPNWYAVLDISGCKMLDMPVNVSSDSLQYLAGLQWKARPEARWKPHLQFLLGGNKTTREVIDPEKRKLVLEANRGTGQTMPYDQFAVRTEANGLAMAAGGGIDLKITNALSWRVAGLEYVRTFSREFENVRSQEGLRASMGFVLTMGTW